MLWQFGAFAFLQSCYYKAKSWAEVILTWEQNIETLGGEWKTLRDDAVEELNRITPPGWLISFMVLIGSITWYCTSSRHNVVLYQLTRHRRGW